jgi:RecB family exonuclease
VLWYGFVEDGARGQMPPWSAEERQWLDYQDIRLDDPRQYRRREFSAARRAALMAARKLILVRPASVGGTAVGDHPLWTRLAAAFEPDRSHLQLVEPARRLRDGNLAPLSGRIFVRDQAPELPPPRPARYWTLPADPSRGGDKESVTNLEKLLGCPLAYAISADGLLRSSGFFEVPDDNRMLGNLAHKVIQLLFEESRIWTPSDARNRAGGLFDELVPKMAAPLLEAGQEAGRSASRAMVVRSVARLVGLLGEARLGVEAVEKPVSRLIPGASVELRGKIDMVAATSGRRAVVDFKWRGVTRRRAQLSKGTAVQLAAYSWLLEEEVGTRAEAGFFILDKARLFFSSPEPFTHAHVEGSDLAADWDRTLATYAELREKVRGGQVVARGVPDEDGVEESLIMVVEPPCRYCEFATLCGADGGAS